MSSLAIHDKRLNGISSRICKSSPPPLEFCHICKECENLQLKTGPWEMNHQFDIKNILILISITNSKHQICFELN